MALPPAPKKAQSIEDLLKKPKAAPTPAPTPGFVPGAAPKATKPKAAASKAKSDMTKEEQLGEKMAEIKQRDIEKLTKEKADSLGLPYIDLKGFPVAPDVLALLPREEAEAAHTIIFLKQDDEVRLATSKPGPQAEALAARIAKEQLANVQLYIASEPGIIAALKLYDALPEVKEIIYGVRIDEADLEKYEREISDFRELQEKISKVSTTDIITLLIGTGLKSNASDIHVEAEEKDVKIRLRLDGLLHDAAKLPRDAWKQMISRLKLLAGAKINIEGVPQDGRITIYLSNEKIDIRVSFLPTAYGESVVMRLLRPKTVSLDFDKLGVRGRALEQLEREIQRPNGMIVTTGPTGSGKTTTLYAMLKKINTPDVKIITLEDPIEYKLEGINQSQIDHTKQYDFARGLRSVLRQDPDIVMVGEIRDLETAEISIQAALTGHLVLSTLHTNNAAAAIPRFLSMGVKPFLLAPAINAIIGQRLVRRLCDACKVKTDLESSVLAQVEAVLAAIPKNSGSAVDPKKMEFYAPPAGENACKECNGLGYKGRIGIYEVLAMSKEIEREILKNNVSEYRMAELAAAQGMITMTQDGLLKALDGLTSVDEVLRVAEIASVTEDVPEEGAETS